MIDLHLLIQIAEIKKQSSRHGSMSQRWWQNRIYGLQFGTYGESPDKLRMFVREAIIITEMALANPKVARTNKNGLRGFISGLRDVKLAIEQRTEHAQAHPLPRQSGPFLLAPTMDGATP